MPEAWVDVTDLHHSRVAQTPRVQGYDQVGHASVSRARQLSLSLSATVGRLPLLF